MFRVLLLLQRLWFKIYFLPCFVMFWLSLIVLLSSVHFWILLRYICIVPHNGSFFFFWCSDLWWTQWKCCCHFYKGAIAESCVGCYSPWAWTGGVASGFTSGIGCWVCEDWQRIPKQRHGIAPYLSHFLVSYFLVENHLFAVFKSYLLCMIMN